MSNPAVIELIKTNLRNNDLSIEDNLGESIHLHLGYLRMDFTIKEYKDFCLLIRKTLDTMNINLDLHNILPFDLQKILKLHVPRSMPYTLLFIRKIKLCSLTTNIKFF